MNFKIINKEGYEILAEFRREGYYNHYVLRQNNVALVYTTGVVGFYEIDIVENYVDVLEKEIKKDTESIKYFKEIIGVMRKFNRNAVIDELLDESSLPDLKVFNPLVFAC